jgi:hypothetical protein
MGSGAGYRGAAILRRRTVCQVATQMMLPRRLFGQPARFWFATAFRLFHDRLPQRRLQGRFVTRFDKVPNADTEAPRKQPKRLKRGISLASLELSEKPGSEYVGGGLDLSQASEPPGSPYIGAYKSSKSAEVHELSRTRTTLLLETNKRKILLDRSARSARFFNRGGRP